MGDVLNQPIKALNEANPAQSRFIGKYELEPQKTDENQPIEDTRIEGSGDPDGEIAHDALDTELEEGDDKVTEPKGGDEVTGPEGKPDPEAAKLAEKDGEVDTTDSDFDAEFPVGEGPSIDLGDGKFLKATDFKTPELFDQVSKGFMRTADYTQKTQALADRGREYEAIIETYNAMQNDPNAPLENYFTQDQMLGSLKRMGFDVPNELFSGNGGENNRKGYVDPAVMRELNYLRNEQQKYSGMVQDREKKEYIASITSTIEDVVKVLKNESHKNLVRKETYAALMDNPHADVRTVAIKAYNNVRGYLSEVFKAKTNKKIGTVVSRGRGGGAASRKNAVPQTWDDIPG